MDRIHVFSASLTITSSSEKIESGETNAIVDTITITLCKCGLMFRSHWRSVHSSRTITSFTEKIRSGETNGCNDGIPLFRLMDCSRGAVFRGFWVRKVATSHQTAGIQSPFYIVWANNRICVFSFTGSTDQRITAEFRAEQNYTFNLYNPRADFIRGYKLSFLLFNFPIIGRVTASLWVTDAP